MYKDKDYKGRCSQECLDIHESLLKNEKDAIDTKVINLYINNNMSLREVAKEIGGMSHITVRNILIEHNVDLKTHGFQSERTKAANVKRSNYIPPRPCKVCSNVFTPKRWNYYTCSQDCSFELLSINNSSEGRAEYARHIAEVDLDYLRELHNDKSKSIEVKLYLTDLRVKEYKELTKNM